MPKYEDSDDYRHRLLEQQEAAAAPRDFSGVARRRFAWAQHVVVEARIRAARRADRETGFVWGAVVTATLLLVVFGLILLLGERR